LREKGVEGILKKKKEIDDEWKKQPVLIAIVGQAGSGKSTIVRRLLGYKPDDQNEPIVGKNVTECTKEDRVS
jgi:GTPase SAR1 family protein